MNMQISMNDPRIEKMYRDLIKQDIKNLISETPEQSSETWQAVKRLYKQERKKRWKTNVSRAAVALTAAVVIGSVVYKQITHTSKV